MVPLLGATGLAPALRFNRLQHMVSAPQARLLVTKPFPVREYISRSLYDKDSGYFTSGNGPLLPGPSPLSLRPKPGSRSGYEHLVASRYRTSPGWLTPVELFSPYFSRAVARHALQACREDDSPLHIFEVGGGTGRLARDILDVLTANGQLESRSIRYTIVEISPNLVEQQRRLLDLHIDRGIARVISDNAIDWLERPADDDVLSVPEEHVHVLAMEVFDNMPHDLIRLQAESASQAYVQRSTTDDSLEMVWSNRMDGRVIEAIHAFGLAENQSGAFFAATQFLERLVSGGKTDIWVPTECLRLLKALRSRWPRATCTISDFSHFPGAVSGRNGPVIQRVSHGKTITFASLLDAPQGECDIMFPTDFVGLEKAFWFAGDEIGLVSSVLPQQQFFTKYSGDSDLASCTLEDGWNPVLSEFTNAKVFCVSQK